MRRESRRRPRPHARRQRPAVRPDLRRPRRHGGRRARTQLRLLVAAEPAERRTYEGEPRTHRNPALDAQWVLDQGGDVLKFFVQLRADRPASGPGEPDLVAEALAVCEEIIRDCRATGVPVVIENLVYARPGEDLSGRAREDAVIESARALNDLDIDLLKLEYPGSPEGCRRLASILDRPWAVLSAGVPFDQFTDIIQIAAEEGGASGFIAGRSVWREVVSLTGQQRQEFLTSVALPRLERLITVAERSARPWTQTTSQHSRAWYPEDLPQQRQQSLGVGYDRRPARRPGPRRWH